MEITEEQIEKLPIWAKRKIRVLISQNEFLERKLKEHYGEKETNTFIQDMLELEPLPNNADIVFCIGERKQNKVRARVKGDSIYISTSSGGVDQTFINPVSSNAFEIHFLKSI